MAASHDAGSSRLSATVNRRSARRLGVILGDQLHAPEHPLLDRLDRSTDVLLMAEGEEESTHVPSHVQRTVLFLSAMRHRALELMDRGWCVRYVALDTPHNTQTLAGEIERAARLLSVERIELLEPGEHRLRGRFEELAAGLRADSGTALIVHDDPHFLVDPEGFADWANGRKELILEHFCRRERRRLGVLVEDGEPAGGKWNHDHDNRASFGRDGPPTLRKRPMRFRPDAITREVIDVVRRRLPALPGRLDDPGDFAWPVTRAEALRALDDFLEHRLPDFGTHQDAMWEGEPFLFHSLLSPVMNLKLLDPREVVDRALGRAERGDVPVNSLEGFVRQIIGWREFIRGVYDWAGPQYTTRNGLDQHGDLPSMYWSGETDMACMRSAIGQVLEHGYGHHIQRLMVTGNFALLAGIHPKAISDWYLGMYVDGVDWVTLPNTLGMAMHADGGVVGTKPYAASGKYIARMSNHCRGCRYDVRARTGPDACPFNVLYWDFLLRHSGRFSGNPRMNLVMKSCERLSGDERTELTVSARRIREDVGVGPISR